MCNRGVQIALRQGTVLGVLMPIGYYGFLQCIHGEETYSIRVRKLDKISFRQCIKEFVFQSWF